MDAKRKGFRLPRSLTDRTPAPFISPMMTCTRNLYLGSLSSLSLALIWVAMSFVQLPVSFWSYSLPFSWSTSTELIRSFTTRGFRLNRQRRKEGG